MTAMTKIDFNTQINPHALFTEPLWKDQIERWYQLDTASLVVCQAIYEWQNKNNFILPDVIIYEFFNGSNFADHEYAKLLDPSPAKFVYTLPNIPIATAQQLLKISVPAFCISNLENQLNSKTNWFVNQLVKKYKTVLTLSLKPPAQSEGQLWTVSASIYQSSQVCKEIPHVES